MSNADLIFRVRSDKGTGQLLIYIVEKSSGFNLVFSASQSYFYGPRAAILATSAQNTGYGGRGAVFNGS